jgi:hypothetical protein
MYIVSRLQFFSLIIKIAYIMCSEHIDELKQDSLRNIKQRHEEQFSNWFHDRVSIVLVKTIKIRMLWDIMH